MEIEKTLTVSAPREQVWALLLDPRVMGGAVPGMKSIEVVSPTEYVAEMHQKISFISAKFKLRTHIIEQRAPEYLRAEGTGEDAAVASSLKQRSDVFLTATPDGGTELRIKVNVDVLGRLGTFGLAVMKTKADRIWDEFGDNLRARIEAGGAAAGNAGGAAPSASPEPGRAARAVAASPVEPVAADAPALAAPAPSMAPAAPSPERTAARPSAVPAGPSVQIAVDGEVDDGKGGFWSRLLRGGRVASPHGAATAAGRAIRIEVRQFDRTVSVEWPLEAADQCRDWLQDILAGGGAARPVR